MLLNGSGGRNTVTNLYPVRFSYKNLFYRGRVRYYYKSFYFSTDQFNDSRFLGIKYAIVRFQYYYYPG